jgi:CBS domain-containing protein
VDLKGLRVRDVMTAEVATIGRNDSLALADQIMELGRIRHLPVLDEDGRLAGVLSRRDLLRGALASALGYGQRAQQRLLETLVVKDAMTTDPRTISPDAPLAAAAETMTTHKIGCLPVLQGEKLVGVLTEGTFVELVARASR